MRSLLLLVALVLPLADSTPVAAEEGDAKIAVFALDRSISEAPVGEDIFFGSVGTETFNDLVTRLKKAADDDEVRAVVLLPDSGRLGYGQIEEVRRVLDTIKASGKGVHVHADALSMPASRSTSPSRKDD